MKPIYEIIVRPLLTEKNTRLTERTNTYCFEVGMNANKIEIAAAVEELFDVKVDAVRTLVAHGKSKRFGRVFGRRPNWKKAYVTLAGDAQLDLVNLA